MALSTPHTPWGKGEGSRRKWSGQWGMLLMALRPNPTNTNSTTILNTVTMLPTVPVSEAPLRLTYMNKATTSSALTLMAKSSALKPKKRGDCPKWMSASLSNSTKKVPKITAYRLHATEWLNHEIQPAKKPQKRESPSRTQRYPPPASGMAAPNSA